MDLTRAGRAYAKFAIILANTLVLLAGITFLSYPYYYIRDRNRPRLPVYSTILKPRALHRMSADQAASFFQFFDRMGEAETYVYQPWIAFSERVFHSEKLNVDETIPFPTRRTWQDSASIKPSLVIWTFGGSTMFGWGVPDNETIASHLAKSLTRALPERSVRVVNHGHSYFFSSQELALFQTLLRRRGRCDFAVFLDGLNDSMGNSLEDNPAFTARLRAAFENEQARNPTASTTFWISPEFPLLRLLRGIRRRIAPQRETSALPLPTYDAVAKYESNRTAEAALGTAQGVQTLFFWQPVPEGPDYAGARALAARIRQSTHSNNFYYLADIFDDSDPQDVYVDQHHYGDTASERIAGAMAKEILEQIRRP